MTLYEDYMRAVREGDTKEADSIIECGRQQATEEKQQREVAEVRRLSISSDLISKLDNCECITNEEEFMALFDRVPNQTFTDNRSYIVDLVKNLFPMQIEKDLSRYVVVDDVDGVWNEEKVFTVLKQRSLRPCTTAELAYWVYEKVKQNTLASSSDKSFWFSLEPGLKRAAYYGKETNGKTGFYLGRRSGGRMHGGTNYEWNIDAFVAVKEERGDRK